MPRGAGKKREKEYQKLEKEFHESGRYKGREKEVASRIVNKQRAAYGETKAAKEQDKRGESPDRNLPLEDYDRLTVDQVVKRLSALSQGDLQQVKSYEQKHKGRKSLLEQLDRRLQGT